MLGFNHSEETRLKLSISRRGLVREIKKNSSDSSVISKIINPDTIQKLKQRTKGVIIKVFDKNENIIYDFPTIIETAKFFGVKASTISSYAETGRLWDNKFFFKKEFKPIESKVIKVPELLSLDKPKFNSKGNLIEVLDQNNKLTYQFSTIRDVASFFNVSHPTVLRYIKNGT